MTLQPISFNIISLEIRDFISMINARAGHLTRRHNKRVSQGAVTGSDSSKADKGNIGRQTGSRQQSIPIRNATDQFSLVNSCSISRVALKLFESP